LALDKLLIIESVVNNGNLLNSQTISNYVRNCAIK